MHAHRQRREKTTKNVCSTSVGSAALPGSEASDYTYTKVHEKINHYNKAEKTRETLTRQKIRENRRAGVQQCKRREEKQEARERGLGGPALMTVAAATSLAAGTNQRPFHEDVAHGPALSARATCTLSPEKHVPGCEGSATLL